MSLSACLSIFVSVCLISCVLAQDYVCRAIALGGGGDRGAYEAGAIKALVDLQAPEKVKYEVVTGISAGSWNAAGLGQFKIGDEKAASVFLVNQWMNIKASDIYKNWFPGGVVEGLWLKSGLFDSSPQIEYSNKFLNDSLLKTSDRIVNIGATSIDRSRFILFNQTDVNFKDAVRASSAIPGIFPVVIINDEHFVDGGAEYMTPITDAIAQCMAKYSQKGINNVKVSVDVVLAIADTPMPEFFKKLLITPFVLLRTAISVVNNIFVEDIQSASIAFPNAQIRVIKPQEWLPGYFLGFDHSKELIGWGYNDAARVINSTAATWF